MSVIEKIIEEIYADGKVSPSEVIHLRNVVDGIEEKVLNKTGKHSTVGALVSAFDVATQLIQEALLKIRKGDMSQADKELAYEMIKANVALLEANLKAFGR